MNSEHGIDITELEAEEALSVVGTGDWLVALIDGVPDIIIPARWRMSLHEYAAKQFVRWVIAGVDRSISHDSDPSCDSSGSIRRTQTDSLMLLI